MTKSKELSKKPVKNTASNPIDALISAVDFFGGQKELAETLGAFQSNISSAINGERRLPVKQALLIESLTGGKITKEQLRPDVFVTIKSK